MEDENFGVVVPDPPISHTTTQNVTEEKDMSTKTKVSSETTETSKMLEPLDSSDPPVGTSKVSSETTKTSKMLEPLDSSDPPVGTSKVSSETTKTSKMLEPLDSSDPPVGTSKVSSETTKTSKMLEPLDSSHPPVGTSKTNDNKRKLVDTNTDSDSDSDCIGDVSSDTDDEKKQQKKKVKPSTSYINQDGPTVRDELTRHGQSVSDVAHNFNYFKEVSMKAARYADYMETQFLNFMDMNYKEAMAGRHFSTKVPFNFEKLNKSIKGIKGRHSKISSSSAQKNPKKPKPKSDE